MVVPEYGLVVQDPEVVPDGGGVGADAGGEPVEVVIECDLGL